MASRPPSPAIDRTACKQGMFKSPPPDGRRDTPHDLGMLKTAGRPRSRRLPGAPNRTATDLGFPAFRAAL